MGYKSTLFLLVAFVLLSSCAYATQTPVTIDLNKLSPELAAQVMEAKKASESTVPKIPDEEKVEQWVNIGEKIGQAIAGACKELSVGVNEFIATPAGKITVLMIAWKVVGDDLWSIIGGTLAWFVITLIILWSYRHFHMNERVVKKVEGGDQVEYVSRYDFEDDGKESISFWTHVVLFVLFTVICLVIVF